MQIAKAFITTTLVPVMFLGLAGCPGGSPSAGKVLSDLNWVTVAAEGALAGAAAAGVDPTTLNTISELVADAGTAVSEFTTEINSSDSDAVKVADCTKIIAAVIPSNLPGQAGIVANVIRVALTVVVSDLQALTPVASATHVTHLSASDTVTLNAIGEHGRSLTVRAKALKHYNPCAFEKAHAGAVVVQINLRQTTYPTLKQALTYQ